MRCPTCGAVNDPANRFCDQCGSRLEPGSPGAAAPVQTTLADQPTANMTTCPQCGSPVMPGEAFCDECGAPLSPTAPSTPASYDAPTVYAPIPPVDLASIGPDAPTSLAAGPICSICGHQNLPGDRFCDNCGASLIPVESASSPAIMQDTTTMSDESKPTSDLIPPPAHQNEASPNADTPTSEHPVAPPVIEEAFAPTIVSAPAPTREPTATPNQGAEEPPAATDKPDADQLLDLAPIDSADQPPALADEPASVPEPSAASPAQSSSTILDQAGYAAEHARLEGLIAQNQQIISQLEPVQTALGAATPPGVSQSLEQARQALTDAQAELAALQPPAPAVDPAEVARLEGLIAQNQQIISQLEPVQTALGAATPPGVSQSLEQARQALADAQAELAALTGGAPAPAPALATESVAIEVEEPSVAPAPELTDAAPAPAMWDSTQTPTPSPLTAVPPPAETPLPPLSPPAVSAPRLVIDGDKELPLAADKVEFIIGREDPISGIFPEIDLTPFGGETGGVSRQHARIDHGGNGWTITDLNSTNYTRVDGARIDPNVPVSIRDGSHIQLGRIGMTFRET
jgi:uncharacterized OB-fold protein